MKYNFPKKEVNTCDRILCFLLVLSVASLLFFCTSHPLTACALGEADTIASDIKNFYEDSKRELDRVERAIASDINNGNLDATSALYSEYMSVLALQYAMTSSPNISTLAALASAYNDDVAEAQKFVDYLNDNPTTLVSGSGSSGLYRSDIDNNLHTIFCTIGDGSNSMWFSDEFSLTWDVTNISDSYSSNSLRSGSSGTYDYNFYKSRLANGS